MDQLSLYDQNQVPARLKDIFCIFL